MKALTKVIIVLVMLSGGAFLNLYVCCSPKKALSKENTPNTKEAVFKVEGMTCGMCPLTIKAALKRLGGVVSADVSYRDKEAKVSYEEDKVTVDEIVRTIENAGFKAVPLDKEGK
ncbi:MAG TPA: heavy metal-associated domain-containing protein [Thermodesulfobacteriota bacterium]|nr:heavy metal-associated domain-containing protein [Thermodesulfobacteriota bacterium]